VFVGEHHLRLDEKGRLFLPPKFRDDLAGGVMLTKAPDRCLTGFTVEAFQAKTQALMDAPLSDAAARSRARMLGASGTLEVPDRQGRITVPPGLRAYARIERDAVVVGALNRMEIWDPDGWAAYSAVQEEDLAGLAEEGMPGLF
jgi:MraZ protein